MASAIHKKKKKMERERKKTHHSLGNWKLVFIKYTIKTLYFKRGWAYELPQMLILILKIKFMLSHIYCILKMDRIKTHF